MPTVFRVKRYRFFFFSREGRERPHIHVERAERYAKFWLDPVALARSKGFQSQELREIKGLIDANRDRLWERWNEYFGNQG